MGDEAEASKAYLFEKQNLQSDRAGYWAQVVWVQSLFS